MVVRVVVALTALLASAPAFAEPLNADAARRFVAGKMFTFNCFEGTVGSGRIFNDGSVAGMMRMRGSGPVRFMRLPAGTLFAKGDSVCSNVKGAFFNPCFNLDKTSERSFRGAVSGFGFAYCDFKHGSGREMIAAVGPSPDDKLPMPTARSIRRGVRHQHAQSESTASVPAAHALAVAAPTTPVTAAPLPTMEQTGMRGSVSQ
jgi:hypothetical protein